MKDEDQNGKAGESPGPEGKEKGTAGEKATPLGDESSPRSKPERGRGSSQASAGDGESAGQEKREAKPSQEEEKKGDSSDKSEDETPSKGAKPAGKKPAAKPEGKKPAKPAPKKRPPRRPVKGPQYEDLDDSDELLTDLRERFPEAEISGQKFLEQPIYTVPAEDLFEVMVFLRDNPRWSFDYLVDLTLLDYLGDERRYCLVYHLYAYPDGPLIRIKSRLGEDEVAPSVTAIWQTADWLEREAYDMFGVEFSGHPDLRRILLPEDWHGHPLRKDYDIKLQDQSWIREHLRIRKVPN